MWLSVLLTHNLVTLIYDHRQREAEQLLEAMMSTIHEIKSLRNPLTSLIKFIIRVHCNLGGKKKKKFQKRTQRSMWVFLVPTLE